MAKKVLVTSALPYVNNIPHLGNLVGAVLSADVYARHKRLQGHEVLYVCGADEHGTTTEIKAREEGVTPQELCDKYGVIHKNIYDWFNISFDVWGRTHTTTHTEITQSIFKELLANGYVTEQEIEQLFDEQEQTYLSDRFVEGTCPYCGEEGARGDQCDSCQQLIHAPELKNPVSKLSGTKPVVKKTKHLYIDLPELRGLLEPWLEKTSDDWSKNTVTTTQTWLETIKPRAITRDLDWGVPVPLPGYEHKVFYVWFDAPIGYISITAHAKKDWKDWWKNPAVELAQFMGKDNIVFHSVLFPSTLLGTDDTWTLAHTINTTEFLNYEDKKFSKSKQTGVFGDDCIRIEETHGIPSDVWRHYLISTRPEHSDSTFTWDELGARTNNELIATYANLVHRTLHFAHKHTPHKATLDQQQKSFLEENKEHYKKILSAYDRASLRTALQEIMLLAKRANTYFQQAEPWKHKNNDAERAAKDVLALAITVRDLAILLSPVTPDGSKHVLDTIGIQEYSYETLGTIDETLLTNIQPPRTLYNKLEAETIKALKQEYSGNTTDLDLRVAKILSVEDHPDADKLYVLKLSLGNEERQLVAGLKQHYTQQELEGKNIIIVANLEPANLRGKKSEGMLLASENNEGTVGLLLPQQPVGTRLTIDGKQGRETTITFKEFTQHTITSDETGITIDDERLDDDTKVDKQAYGKVR